MDSSSDRIVSLDQSDDFRVAEGDPDIRGWEVLGSDGERIGEVDDLLVDPEAMKVRYIEVEVDRGLHTGRHVLIPIDHARPDDFDDRLRVDGLDSSRVGDLPDLREGSMTEAQEGELTAFFEEREDR